MSAPLQLPFHLEIAARREVLASVAARHATVAVPAAVIERAETDQMMNPKQNAWVKRPFGVAGSIGTAARELRETVAQVVVARAKMVISFESLAEMGCDLEEVEAMIALLRDQLNAASEDRFDANNTQVAK